MNAVQPVSEGSPRCLSTWAGLIFLAACLTLIGSSIALADPLLINPGDTGTVILNVAVSTDSVEDLPGVSINITGPQGFLQVFPSSYSIDDIAVGDSTDVVFSYSLSTDAADGYYSIVFGILPNRGNTVPLDGSFTSRADLIVDQGPLVHLTLSPPGGSGETIDYQGTGNESITTIDPNLHLAYDSPFGIRSVVLTRNGSLVTNAIADAGGVSLANMPDGNYTFVVTDGRGTQTSGDFTKYTFTLSVSPQATKIVFPAVVSGQGGDVSFAAQIFATFQNTAFPVQSLAVYKAGLDAASGVYVRQEQVGATIPVNSNQGTLPVTCEPSADLVCGLRAGAYFLAAVDANAVEIQLPIFLDVNSMATLTDDFSGLVEPTNVQVGGAIPNCSAAGCGSALSLKTFKDSNNRTSFERSGTYLSQVLDLYQINPFLDPNYILGAALLATGPDGFLPIYDFSPIGDANFSGAPSPATAVINLLRSDTPNTSGAASITLKSADNSGPGGTLHVTGTGPMALKRYMQVQINLTSGGQFALAVFKGVYNPVLSFVTVLPSPGGLYGAFSAAQVNGAPALSLTANVGGLSVAPSDPGSPSEASRLAQMSDQGEQLAGGIYNVDPETLVNSSAVITMPYDPQALTAQGLDVTTLALYSAVPGGPFIKVASQGVGPGSQHTIKAFVTGLRLGSDFALFAAPLPPPPPAPAPAAGLALSADAQGGLWEVVLDSADYKLARFSPGGTFLSAALLPGAVQGQWSLSFNAAGEVVAVNSDQNASVSIYRASSSGILFSSAAFSGIGFVQDSAAGVWLAGAQTPDNGQTFNLALWKYDPVQNLLNLTTTYSRGAGFDAGLGVAVDAAGNPWVAGYSSSTALDLAVWKFSLTGTALLAGPFIRPAYEQDLSSPFNAQIAVSTSAVFVAASRLNAQGGNDLALDAFKLDGTLIIEQAFSSASPASIVLSPSGGAAVAGSANGGEGVWLYDSQGNFLSAQQAFANDLAYSGTDLWLSQDQSSAPARFTGGAALSGANTVYASSGLTIDARAFYGPWSIDGVVDSTGPALIHLDSPAPGTYFLHIPGGNAGVTFRILTDGALDYDSSLDPILAGRGSRTLTLLPVLKITVDASALGTQWSIDYLIDPTTPAIRSVTGLLPGTYTLRVPGTSASFNFQFQVGGNGMIDYDHSLDSLLSGRGTNRLTVSPVLSITVDASAMGTMWSVDYMIDPSTPSVRSVTGLLPGPYVFRIPGTSASFNFQFMLSGSGTIDYDHSLDSLLSGRGTNRLTVNPVMRLTVDASALGVPWSIDYTIDPTTPSVRSVTGLLPGPYVFRIPGMAEGFTFRFLLANDGTIDFDHSLDSLVDGRGGKTLRVNPILAFTVNASALSSAWLIDSLTDQWLPPGTQRFAGLLPGAYVFHVQDTGETFNIRLNLDGSVSGPNSLGVVVTPSGESTPPVTTLVAVGSSTFEGTYLYIHPGSSVALTAIDPPGNAPPSGVNTIYYTIDVDPFSPDCEFVPVDGNAPPGTCANEAYAGPFSVSLGTHTVFFFAEDNIGNQENIHTALLAGVHAAVSSATVTGGAPEMTFAAVPPVTAVVIDSQAAQGNAVLVAASSNNVLSAGTIYSLGPENMDFNPPAALVFHYSTADLAAAGLGPDSIKIYHYENGNIVPVASQVNDTSAMTITLLIDRLASTYAVFGPDVVPPVTKLFIDGTTVAASAVTVSTRSLISLSATDAGAGVAKTYYSVDGGPAQVYGGPFSLANSTRTVSYYSKDKAGNVETARSVLVSVDLLPPRTSLVVGSPKFGSFISSSTPLSLQSVDDAAILGDALGLGVALLRVAVDTGAFAPYAGAFTLANSGARTVRFFGVDKASHTESAQSAQVFVDTTPPTTVFSLSAQVFASTDGTRFILPGSSVALSASDPGGAGVGLIETSVDNPAFGLYVSSLVFYQGRHVLGYRATDSVGNREAQKSLTIYVDTVAPVTTLLVNGSPASTGAVSANATDSFSFTAFDSGSGAAATLYGVDGSALSAFRSAFAIAPGTHTLVFQSRDNAGNLEALRSVVVSVQGQAVTASAALDPRTLNLKSNGQYVSAAISVTAGETAADIVVGSVRVIMVNGTTLNSPIFTDPQAPSSVGPDGLKVKFPRARLEAVLPANQDDRLTLAWSFRSGAVAMAGATIHVTDPGLRAAVISADPAFRMNDVFADPNPAIRAGVTIRVQPGQADSVEVAIYNMFGRAMQSGRVSYGQILDAGNGKGPQWTFDYGWDASKAGSGVYFFTVTARKSGQADLHATGKVAVIR